MSLTVSFAVLLAALLHASWNAMIKGGNDVLLDTAAIVAGAGLVALPFVFLVPLPAPASWPYILRVGSDACRLLLPDDQRLPHAANCRSSIR